MAQKPCGSFKELAYIDTDDSGVLALKRSHQYFDQLILYMAVCKQQHADFVLWSQQETVVIPVRYDASHWEELFSNIIYFYKRFMLPALLHDAQEYHLHSNL